jgi:3-oxoacyl-[acyl-carrier-protein] synthase-3
MSRYAHITGWGMAVPDRVMTNDDLSRIVDTNNEWIIARTGIRERRIAQAGESTATLAAEAACLALEATDIDEQDVDLIIVATSSPEHLFPSTASLVQDMIGAEKAGAFDLSAACTGFIFALNMASQAIISGSIDNAIVIGAETLSRLINWKDRTTCILFGDGAGAFVVQAREKPGGVAACIMRSDGSGGDLLSVPAGGSRIPASEESVARGLHTIQMNGREVFRFATRVMATATREVVAASNSRIEDVNLVIPHQANRRIIETAARNLRMPKEKFYINLERYGNTSTASIPMAFCEAHAEGAVHDGDKIVLVGFGAGLTWGALLLNWAEPERVVSKVRIRRRRIAQLLARLRSWFRRIQRRVEGLIFRTTARGKGD